MPSTNVTVVALVCMLVIVPTAALAEHPIAGVISMLQDLEVQSKEEGAAETALFQKFSYWCKSTTTMLTKSITKEKATIAELEDKITGLKADIATLGEEIAQLGTDISDMNTAAAKAKKLRDDENALYKSEQTNFDGTIKSIDGAIDGMAPSSFLQGRKFGVAKPPAAKTYDFKSGGIIETFKGMNTQFEAEKLDSTQAETNKLNAYKLAKQARDTAIKTAQDSKSEKEGIKGDKEADLADAETARSQEQSALESDAVSLDDTEAECKAKTSEWEQRSAVRAGEIEAMVMAQKILAKVTGVRNPDEHEVPTKSLLAARTRVFQDSSDFRTVTGVLAFLQTDDPRVKVVTLLRQAAEKGHSKALQDLAEQLRTYDGPFDKIKGMMQKMIFRLMAEQKDEDDHKNWCDLETEKNTESKADKDGKMKDLSSKISAMDSSLKVLTGQIGDNDVKVEQITEYMKEETELRSENHAEILATIKDSQDAQAAVTQATAVLKDFYKNSGEVPKEPWEFLQRTTRALPAKPSTWDSSYTGVADPDSNGGVLTLLDGVMQKFSTMEADAKAADATDQKNFDKDMAAKKVELATTQQDSQMKTQKKDSLQEKMDAAASQLKATTAEHDAVHQYLKDLEPACGTGDSSYDDRKQARSDEITALRKAQGILEEAFRAKGFLQQRK